MVVAIVGITTGSTFMVMPFFVLFLTATKHLSVGSAAVLLAALTVIQRGGTFLAGLMSDRYNPRKLMAVGALIEACSFAAFIVAHSLSQIGACAVTLGVGGALLLPACKTILAQSSDTYGPRIFALRTTATNMGGAVGPLVGGLFYTHFSELLLSCALLYVACSIAIMLVPVHGRPRSNHNTRLSQHARMVLTDRLAVCVVIASIGFWICYTQFTFTIPLFAVQILPGKGDFGIFASLNSVVIIVLQFPLLKKVLRSSESAISGITAGMICMVIAFLALPAWSGASGLVMFTLLFSVSELIVAPSLDAASYAISRRGHEASYLGFVSASWAVGAIVGNLIGAHTFSLGDGVAPHLFCWLACAGVAAISSVIFATLRGGYRQRILNGSEELIEDGGEASVGVEPTQT